MKILEIASMVITIIGFVATIIFGFLPLHERMNRMEEAVLLKHFTITYPIDNTIVESSQVINGRTPFLTLNHYILSAPMETNDVYVQDGPLKVSTGGLWVGMAKFDDTGTSKKFLVQVVATKAVLPHGLLTKSPGDALYSEAITVIKRE
ncbi:MAG: hypothetical protein A3E19_03080 [Planctomycetes bacterium RIFCSPHIGHO2_12_FULL_52_36]|nr:MAG: hypothetical protein A3D89_05580 [Planctomycetes bacterium RIFCSPHIGHO2_02_FULL_52_58]OHB93632.1 MAG: hypothetical protein A3E19_03080 [Planctomycetes bacterium RIFCSPHIGHO2_12_FULL_52_36]